MPATEFKQGIPKPMKRPRPVTRQPRA